MNLHISVNQTFEPITGVAVIKQKIFVVDFPRFLSPVRVSNVTTFLFVSAAQNGSGL